MPIKPAGTHPPGAIQMATATDIAGLCGNASVAPPGFDCAKAIRTLTLLLMCFKGSGPEHISSGVSDTFPLDEWFNVNLNGSYTVVIALLADLIKYGGVQGSRALVSWSTARLAAHPLVMTTAPGREYALAILATCVQLARTDETRALIARASDVVEARVPPAGRVMTRGEAEAHNAAVIERIKSL